MTSTLSTLQNHQYNTQQSLEKTNAARDKISSGMQASSYGESPREAIPSDIETSKTIELDALISREKTRDVELSKEETALQTVVDAAIRLKGLIVGANTATKSGNTSFALLVQGELDTIVGQLNKTDSSGSYFFAGTKITTKPVDITGLPRPDTNDMPSTAYYKGNATTDDGLHLIKADDAGISKIIHAARMALTTDVFGTPDAERLATASEILQEGIKETSGGPLSRISNERGKIIHDLDYASDQSINLSARNQERTAANTFKEIEKANYYSIQMQAGYMTSQENLRNLQTFLQIMRG